VAGNPAIMRATPLPERRGNVINVPVEIFEKCKCLLALLGLVSGSFDFIRTENNDYIFLEVNFAEIYLDAESGPEYGVFSIFLSSFAGANFSDDVEVASTL
jgi:hypothetical protein